MFKVNDFVYVNEFPTEHHNHVARVVAVDNNRKTVMVSNTNMPFIGTLMNVEYNFKDVTPQRKAVTV